MPGATSSVYLLQGQWRVAAGYRTFHSHRHFTGATEDTFRADDESEVVNDVHALDLSAMYALTERFNLFAAVPLTMARRSLPVRGPDRAVIGRYLQRATGVGDLSLGARAWLRDPLQGPRFNLSLGLGMKLPTGPDGVTGIRQRFNSVTGQIETLPSTVDQSIQLGDGGLGALLQVSGFWLLSPGVVAYVDGSYLFNPRDTNGVETFRGRPSEAIMSVADQYLLRVGGAWSPLWGRGLQLGLGGRIEGVPVRDFIGASNGFRRPGFSISVEPSLGYAWQRTFLSVSVPVALHRERQRSVTDIQDGVHGDAAFADYLLNVGLSYTL